MLCFSIDHLFLHCAVAKFLWSLLQCIFSVNSPPASINSLFTSWIAQYGKEMKMMLFVGISAILWSIWNCRNEICFERRRVLDPFGFYIEPVH